MTKKEASSTKFIYIVTFLCFSCSMAAFALYAALEFKPAGALAQMVFYSIGSDSTEPELKLLFVVFSVVFCFIACRFLCELIPHQKRQGVMFAAMLYAFCIYLFLVVNLTLIDPMFGRNLSNALKWLKWGRSEISAYIKRSSNFIPFHTLKLFFKGWANGYVTSKDAFINLIGNFFIFSPFALFAPALFKQARGARSFFFFITAFVSMIEILQLVLMTGTMDIDDLIFNVTGAMLIYWVIHLKSLKQYILRLTLIQF